jgi:hypothetical protein
MRRATQQRANDMDSHRRLALATAAAALAGAALVPTLAKAGMRHERVRRAIDALRDARAEVESSGTDFGGHKALSIDAIDHAIHELHESIAWADAHGS